MTKKELLENSQRRHSICQTSLIVKADRRGYLATSHFWIEAFVSVAPEDLPPHGVFY